MIIVSKVNEHCRRAAGRALVLAALVGTATPLSAALWESPGWGVIGELRAGAIYDTNLNAQAANISDTYWFVSPELKLVRRGSLTRVEGSAWVDVNRFLDLEEFDSTDPGVRLLIEHPFLEAVEPDTRVDLRWNRLSSTNTDLGRRVRSENMGVLAEFQLFDTGRTAIDARLDGRSSEFLEEDLNTNEAVALEAWLAYVFSEPLRIGLGYGHEWSRSLGGGIRGDTYAEQDMVTVRARGQLFSKVTGSAQAGVAFISYRGLVDRSDTEWIARAALEWQPTAQIVGVIRASRVPDFSPEGETVLRTGLDVEFERELGNSGFSVRLGGGVAQRETSVGVAAHDAIAVTFLAGLNYQLTERFSAELSDRWTEQDADRDTSDYERHFVTGRLNFRF